jgi:hypothetical protein
MGTKDHYVSKFHLREFTDPSSLNQKDPWLWQGWLLDGAVRRRAPKNIAVKLSMFDGPGGLADPSARLEKFLAESVEGPAASTIKEICQRPSGSGGELPPALMRYLAWAAARSLPMKTLFELWAMQQAEAGEVEFAEPPPEGLVGGTDRERSVSMKHPSFGHRKVLAGADMDELFKAGWMIDYDDPDNLLEGIHIQAYYFQVRWFPRFRWYTLHAPKGQFFVIADRAVGWAADGYIEAPPSCLRDPSAYVLAPLSRELVLIGRHTTDSWHVTPGQINALIACWAHEWIAGPTKQTVEDALSARRFALR